MGCFAYPRSSWKMQLGVKASAGGSCAGPVTVVSPPATTYGFMQTWGGGQHVSVGEGKRLERLCRLSASAPSFV